MHSLPGRISCVAAVAVAVLAGGGCTASPATDTSPVTLRIATDDVADTPAGAAILTFAEHVGRLSDGSIVVEAAWHAAGDVDDWDQANARLVSSGEIELGFIPTRAWDVEGVQSLRPLSAPFLIPSNAALEAVLSDRAIAADLLAGLDAVDVIGVDFVPEGLRHPVGYEDPLVGVEDYDGALIRTPRSDTTEAVFASLGATTTPSEFDDLRGSEVSFALANDGIAAVNVVLFPKVQALVANAAAWNDLTEEQRGILQEAAAATREQVFAEWPAEADAAADFCRSGGELVAASEDQLASLRAAVQPVYDHLSADPATADLISRIKAIVATTPPETLVGECEGGADAAAASALDGSYAVAVTADALTARGVTDQQIFDEYVGEWIIELADGDYLFRPAAGGEGWTGTFDVVGERMIWHWTAAAEDWTEADVSVEPDGSLVFSNWSDGSGPEWTTAASLLFSTWTPAP